MLKRFFSTGVKNALASQSVPDVLDGLPGSFMKWDELARAQYLECVTLLSGVSALFAGGPDAAGPLGGRALPLSRCRHRGLLQFASFLV